MKIILTRGDEVATIEADDTEIHFSMAYQAMFERQVKQVTECFYGAPDRNHKKTGT